MKNYKIEIIQDEMPESPRTSVDNLGKLVCFHNRYRLGDIHNISSFDFTCWADLKKKLIKTENAIIVLPVYMYDHSGITISTKPFSCRFDSGQIGFIYATRADILNEFQCKLITKKIIEKAYNILLSEIETYDQFLRGDVYGYKITDEDNNEIDSCWGFYGYDYCLSTANTILDSYKSLELC